MSGQMPMVKPDTLSIGVLLLIFTTQPGAGSVHVPVLKFSGPHPSEPALLHAAGVPLWSIDGPWPMARA